MKTSHYTKPQDMKRGSTEPNVWNTQMATKKDRIRSTLAAADRPLSTNEVADRTKMNWHTAHDISLQWNNRAEPQRSQRPANVDLIPETIEYTEIFPPTKY